MGPQSRSLPRSIPFQYRKALTKKKIFLAKSDKSKSVPYKLKYKRNFFYTKK
jgi:hypothetical protein